MFTFSVAEMASCYRLYFGFNYKFFTRYSCQKFFYRPILMRAFESRSDFLPRPRTLQPVSS